MSFAVPLDAAFLTAIRRNEKWKKMAETVRNELGESLSDEELAGMIKKVNLITRGDFGSNLIEKWELDRDLVEMLLFEALVLNFLRPQLTKNEMVGCHCETKPCKKENTSNKTKIPIECSSCEDDCSICMEPMTENVVKTACGHSFHNDCIKKVKPQSWYEWFPCPLCRAAVSSSTKEKQRAIFELYKDCQCCVRHQTQRPTFFSSDAPYVYTYPCPSKMSKVVRKLLDYNKSRTIKTWCPCRGDDGESCRMRVRSACALIQ